MRTLFTHAKVYLLAHCYKMAELKCLALNKLHLYFQIWVPQGRPGFFENKEDIEGMMELPNFVYLNEEVDREASGEIDLLRREVMECVVPRMS